MFKEKDRDGDGSITMEEYRKSMADKDVDMTDEEIEDWFRLADIDGDGKISQEEYVKMMTGREPDLADDDKPTPLTEVPTSIPELQVAESPQPIGVLGRRGERHRRSDLLASGAHVGQGGGGARGAGAGARAGGLA